ncbi:hypothetical protein Zmor_001495 [Zophobas morio]|uniref:Uncharacterized protein n=1 Tax=Zophobas morio TaxID=2755281 RepID=A0AA38MSD3_9CUCU|nr:hypothetical protein Zmor_001495 [Zophobas morio]
MQDTIIKMFLPLFFLMLLSIIPITNGINSEYKHRTKRKVVFSKSSKFFFRLNGKDNVLNYTEVFAHGWTIRMNYDLPESIPRRHQFFKRDVHAELDTITDESILGVYSCVLKYICESVANLKVADKCGMFCEIGSIIARTATMESAFFKSFIDKCDYHIDNCPYLLKNSVLGYV